MYKGFKNYATWATALYFDRQDMDEEIVKILKSNDLLEGIMQVTIYLQQRGKQILHAQEKLDIWLYDILEDALNFSIEWSEVAEHIANKEESNHDQT